MKPRLTNEIHDQEDEQQYPNEQDLKSLKIYRKRTTDQRPSLEQQRQEDAHNVSI